MAYSLAKIDIRELKSNQPAGVQSFELILGLIPVLVEGYTQISNNTEPSAGQWSYFTTIKTLKINNSSLQSEQYVNYSLLLSNKNSASYALDPTDTLATKYIWPPYLKKAPTVIESAKNILAGLISYNSLTINIQSGEAVPVRQFFGSNFSIMNQNFKMWRIPEDGVIYPVYTGIGTEVKFSSNQVTYTCSPKIKLLDEDVDF
ncbi:MAG: hypothetical protein GY718_04445, partial [Lentisphaerae bacterium]|nr:hypothetical protein [Lentisphaerota bacterium]